MIAGRTSAPFLRAGPVTLLREGLVRETLVVPVWTPTRCPTVAQSSIGLRTRSVVFRSSWRPRWRESRFPPQGREDREGGRRPASRISGSVLARRAPLDSELVRQLADNNDSLRPCRLTRMLISTSTASGTTSPGRRGNRSDPGPWSSVPSRASKPQPGRGSQALDPDGVLDPSATLASFCCDGELLAIGALDELDPHHGEVKSMQPVEVAGGRAIGRAISGHLIGVAR